MGRPPGSVSAFDTIAEFIFKHLASRESTAITTMELYQRVIDDYGAINLRIFFRYMRKLRETKLVAFKREHRGHSFRYWRKP